MTIYVPKQAIEAGVKANPKKCPIALSLRCHGLKHVRVNAEQIIYRDAEGLHSVDIPARMQKLISRFDLQGWITPFSFDLIGDEITLR